MDTATPALRLGLDAGSTTVKLALLDGEAAPPVTLRHARHRGLPLLAMAALLDALPPRLRVRAAVTGSASGPVVDATGVGSVHEVIAVARAAPRVTPGARSVFEIGGQDAKFVALDRGPHAAMNDRCAAGTGVTVDRVLMRLGVSSERARAVPWDAERVRPLSSRCGVFAETDAVNLARAGVGAEDLVVSLADAIARAALAALTRGVVPLGPVVLLGGPAAFLGPLEGAFAHHLDALWRDRGVAEADRGAVTVPAHPLHHAALGAAMEVPDDAPAFTVGALSRALRRWAPDGDAPADRPLATDEREAEIALRAVEGRVAPWRPDPSPRRGVFVGIDAGSTVSKAVAIDGSGTVLARASTPSDDAPGVASTLLGSLRAQLRAVRGDDSVDELAVTGYAAEVVAAITGARSTVLETVAHAMSARAAVPEADVVCDVGGQDVKVLALDARGELRDFRLSAQCCAGVGLALESTAAELGVARDDYATRALAARRAPRFREGCVVFLDADRVGFLRQGFTPDEVLAGLARALPRVVWTHVCQGVQPARWGRTFVLQGGVQRNAAAVHAQVDYLSRAVPGARVFVHPYASEAGALGAALVARGLAPGDHATKPAREARRSLRVVTTDPCALCDNGCRRSLVSDEDGTAVAVVGHACEAGSYLDRPLPENARALRDRNARVPDLMARERALLFCAPRSPATTTPAPRSVRVGIPRTLSMYRAAPLVRGYLRALGLGPRDVVFSPSTSEELVRAGAHRASTDPCFPAKVVPAHVEHLLRRHDAGKRIDALLVPTVTRAATPVQHAVDCASCPVVTACSGMVRAAFEVADDALARRGIELLSPVIELHRPLQVQESLYERVGRRLGATRAASDAAVSAGYDAQRAVDRDLQTRAMRVLDSLGDARGGGARRGAVLVLCRPYHADPGVNHRVSEELRALGYPVLSLRSLPRDRGYLSRLLERDLRRGRIADPFDIRDLLPEADNSGGSERVWGARFAAAHGAIGVLDLGSFKCAQDPLTHGAVAEVLDAAGVARCNLYDLDATRPATSLRLRLRTFARALESKGLSPWR